MAKKFFLELDDEPQPELNGSRDLCEYALDFLTWAEELCEANSKSVVRINQAKVLLVDRYFDWRTSVPQDHRDRISENGHRCIYHVFEHAYRILRRAELSLTPPLLFLPEKPQTPPAIEVPGIFVGYQGE